MTKLLSHSLVFDQIVGILSAWGMRRNDADETASIMVDADLAGIDSHGISMLPSYQQLVESGALNLTEQHAIVSQGESTAVVDGRHNLGHRTAATAMRTAIDKAERTGIGAVAVRHSKHFGAAGYYAAMAAQVGLIGLVTTTTRTRSLVPTRGRRPVLGTNPIAFAAPSGDADAPFILDMSTSTVAVNKVKVYDYGSLPLPEGWMVDSEGGRITDSGSGYSVLLNEHGGGLTPLGSSDALSSHKGYGLAVMVQILAGALAGVSFTRTHSEAAHEGVGHFCLAIDPSCFGDGGDFRQSVSDIVDTLREEAPINREQPVLVAGDLERATRAKRRFEGVPLSEALLEEIEEVCSHSDIEFLLDDGKAVGIT